ncbi:hypothetical protein FRC02_006132 [Tulasnella sp. 418]|nr:hypothetical protein FRC02_006132 [Tulasnella sp. 418]
MDSLEGTTIVEKGKLANHASWNDLPHDVIRLIAEHVSQSLLMTHFNYVPAAWREPYFRQQQLLWAWLMTARRLESIRNVCRNWEVALNDSYFWNSACNHLDPMWLDLQYHPQLNPAIKDTGGTRTALSIVPGSIVRNYDNFNKTLRTCCVVCRFVYPGQSHGINAGREYTNTRWLGEIAICRRHHPENFCGVCLKDTYVSSYRYNAQTGQIISDTTASTIYINEDEEWFSGVIATCYSCRGTAIRDAMRRRGFRSTNPVIEGILEPFIDTGEGTVNDVIAAVEESCWLRSHTNYAELYESACAAEKMRLRQELKMHRAREAAVRPQSTQIADAFGDLPESEDGIFDTPTRPNRLQELLNSSRPVSPSLIQQELERQDEEDEEDEDFIEDEFGELLNSSEELNVKDMALSGWARNRIIDGCWVSPLDLYNKHPCHWIQPEQLQHLTPVWHPVESYMAQPTTGVAPSIYPQMRTLQCPTPPSLIYARAQTAFEQTMRQILLPPFENLVRKLVCESEMDGKDVCKVAGSFSGPRLLGSLTEMQLWAVAYDWSQHLDIVRGSQTSPTITSSTVLDSGSDGDSPPSTIRVSPSPPPSDNPKESKTNEAENTARGPTPVTIPMPRNLLPHIPHIPRCNEFIGAHTMHVIEQIWKEACVGLFRCSCSICLRALAIAEAKERQKRKVQEEYQRAHEQAVAIALAGQVVTNATEQPRMVGCLIPPVVTVPTMVERSQAPPPPSPSLGSVGEEEEAGSVYSTSDRSSSPGPPTPTDFPQRRRSREASMEANEDTIQGGDQHDVDMQEDGRERKRIKMTPPAQAYHDADMNHSGAGRRRSREDNDEVSLAESEETNMDDKLLRKRLRVTTATPTPTT